ncbi:cell division control protein 4, partial [Hymenopellis radicata]
MIASKPSNSAMTTSHFSLPAHGSSVIICLILYEGHLITASDDHSIQVYSVETGQVLHRHSLTGHCDGGVWSLCVIKDTLVSGSVDRTVRIWDLNTGRCTHVFGAHTSTVRCVVIVKPEWVDVVNEAGVITREKWPKRPVIVTGSRDHSIRVWTVPRPGEPEYRIDLDSTEVPNADENPYHRAHLEGHEGVIRGLAARGRTLVSGSYDHNVRVWDLATGACKHILRAHTQKVYAVVLDPKRHQAYSGSMDGNIRVWDIRTGECRYTLSGHTSLIGLLALSPSYLVSGAADATLRVWNPDTGALECTLAEHTDAITCFQHDDSKVLSGSDGILKLWNIKDGTVMRDLSLSGTTTVRQVAFEGRWCVAATYRGNTPCIDVWDFTGDDEWIGGSEGVEAEDTEDED